mgnify:FL=1
MLVEFGLLINALLLGVMISFMIVTSPTVFKTLDGENSKKFLRYIFPRLFNFCFWISAATFLFFLLSNFFYGTVVALGISISFLFNTFFLTPRINKNRDLSMDGDKSSERSFKYLHLASVLLYLLNMLFVVSIFVIYFIK